MKKISAVIGIIACVALLAAACMPFGPTVVAKNSYINSTSSTGTVDLFTPSEDGDYLITIYEAAGNGGGFAGDFHIYWTDDYRLNTVDLFSPSCCTAVNFVQTVHATSGNPIQFKFDYSCPSCSVSYDLIVTAVKQ